MSYVYFLSPVMLPAELQRPTPVMYYPLRQVSYLFPMPLVYAPPPVPVL